MKISTRVLLFSFLLSTVFVSILSTSTSPLYALSAKEALCSTDSAIFQVIGKGWSKGVEPYVGLWDSKGPFIFFVNALGYKLCGCRFGIWILQIVNIAFTLCFVISVFSRCRMSKYTFALSVAIVFMGLAWNYDYGNTVEEYMLLPLMLSVYGFYEWTSLPIVTNYRWQYAAANGAVLAFSLMSRLTNFVGVGFATLFVIVILCRYAKWRNLVVCAIAFVVSFLIVTLPFFAYFLSTGELGEMWYAMFTYNFDYLVSASIIRHEPFYYYVYRFFLCLVPLVGLALHRPSTVRRVKLVGWLLVSLSTFTYLLTTYGYVHYGLIAMPYLVVFCLFLSHTGNKGERCMSAAFLLVSVVFAMRVRFVFINSEDVSDVESVVNIVPKSEHSSLLLYNCSPQCYLILNINPPCRFFALQDWAASNSTSLVLKLKGAFISDKPKWVVVDGKAAVIGTELKQNYRCVKRQGNLCLYRFFR